jgi:hypothetical protein
MEFLGATAGHSVQKIEHSKKREFPVYEEIRISI